MRTPGKKVGSKLYVHKDYAGQVLGPEANLKAAYATAKKMTHEFTIVRYDTKTGELCLLASPDFDTANEPAVGPSLLLVPGNPPKMVQPPSDPWIYHHKWAMVGDDYKGFDIEEAKARSAQYETKVTPDDRRRMGKQSHWRGLIDTLKLKP